MGVVLVMLDAPGLEWEDERHEHECSDNILNQLILAERAVATVVPHNKELNREERRIN